jgi:acylphosphatase
MTAAAARFVVSGQVQGVGFRWFVARHSRRLGLHGQARNLPDGRVEVIAAGSEDGLRELGQLLLAGPEHADVSAVERHEILPDVITGNSFEIL